MILVSEAGVVFDDVGVFQAVQNGKLVNQVRLDLVLSDRRLEDLLYRVERPAFLMPVSLTKYLHWHT